MSNMLSSPPGRNQYRGPGDSPSPSSSSSPSSPLSSLSPLPSATMTTTRMTAGALLWAFTGISLASCATEDASPDELILQFSNQLIIEPADSLLWNELLVAEDARAGSPEQLNLLFDGVSSERADIRLVSARAIGRLEREDLVSHLVPLLDDEDADVRAEAANAIGQSLFGRNGGVVVPDLLGRLAEESDPAVRAVVAQTLGRLRYLVTDDQREVENALVSAAEDAQPETMVGIARGLAAMFRRTRDGRTPSARTHEWLYESARYRPSGSVMEGVRVRRLALATLAGDARVDVGLLGVSLRDPDVEVRRIAGTAAGVLPSAEEREAIVSLGFSDASGQVRYAVLRALGRRMRLGPDCEIVTRAVEDADPHVALLAIDLVGEHCGRTQGVASLLEEESATLADSDLDSWHRPAHALVSLARVDRDRAGGALAVAVEHPVWQVRMYAGRAATTLRNEAYLWALAADDHDNVRETAINGLYHLVGHEADTVYIAQLARQDYQLVMAAARLLEGSPNGRLAVPALMTALERITSERRETSRDPRNALLTRLEELAGRAQADYLASYLRDFDPVIAEAAARVLTAWTGRPWTASPRPLTPLVLPAYEELRALADSHAVFHLRGGTSFELRLLPFEAPTNAWRFARLAREGYYDGLTFHRVEPGFVIQGGSPGANEFVGDGPYSRDELVQQSHLRGTVGISTRGRDTGDGQIFVNLVDNPRLDHNYTIIGEIVRGIEAVDRILEGAVIERIVWRGAGEH